MSEFEHKVIIVDDYGNVGDIQAARRRSSGPLGWAVSEVIGVAIVNPRGVAAGRKSVIVGK